jgi:c-di-GMP-binding flagellar brake protein YcgR
MTLAEISIGSKIELIINEYNYNDEKTEYSSMLLDYIGEDAIVIAAPISEGRIIPLELGTTIGLMVVFQDVMYYFKGCIEKRSKKDNVATMIIKKEGAIKKIQRRNYFRFKSFKKVTFKIVTRSDLKLQEKLINGEEDTEVFEAVTKDISGGGIALLSKKRLHIGDVIKVSISLGDDVNEIIKAKVVRCNLNTKYRDLYEMGLSFVDIKNESRRNIIRYIFRRQSDLKQKGLL